jgi:hypothetical protein
VKDPIKLQNKLRDALKGKRGLNLQLSVLPLTDKEMADAAWIVEGYLQAKDSVVDENDPLRSWIEEYKFYQADLKK